MGLIDALPPCRTRFAENYDAEEALIDDLGLEFFGKVELVEVEEPAEEENQAVTKT